MLFGSNQGHSSFEKTEIGMFRKVMFALSCLVSLICIFVLISHKNKIRRALSGELFTTGAQGDALVSANSSFLENIFSYFGNVSFLFPLVIAFLGYKLFIKKISLRHPDFFVIALVILGFNLLVVGLCSVFSAVSIGSEGSAGGLLGYFFVNAFSSFPYVISKFLPVAISLLGLFLFTSKGPVWYCDTIGSLIFRLINRESAKTQQSDPVPQEPKKEEDHEVFGKSKIRTEHSDGLHLKDELTVPKPDSISAGTDLLDGLDPSSYTSHNISASSTFGQGSIFKNTETKKEDKPLGSKSRSHSQPYRRDSVTSRIEPDFGQIGQLNPLADDIESSKNEGVTNPSEDSPYVSPGEPLSGRSSTSSGSGRHSAFGDRNPVTYVSGAYVNSEQFNSQNGEGAATIISGAGSVPSAREKPSEVSRTIITRVNTGSSAKNQYQIKQEADTSVKDGSLAGSKVIYKAGADHLAPTKTVGSPLRRSDVSTVITRTVIDERVNLNADIQVKEKTGSISGGYSEQASIITRTVPLDSAYNSSEATSQIYSTDDSPDENVINFADFTEKEDSSQIKVDKLTSAFIPTADEERKLKSPETALIKESDESYSQYLKGSRGVISSEPAQPSANAATRSDLQTNHHNGSAADEQQENTSTSDSFAQRMNEIASNLVNEDTISSDETLDNPYDREMTDTASMSARAGEAEPDGSSFDSDLPEDAESPDLGNYESTPPFESMSTANGTIPYSNNKVSVNTPAGQSKATVVYAKATETSPSFAYDEWRPPISLLERSSVQNVISEDEILEKSSALNRILNEFGINAHVANYLVGPVITRFNLSLAPGVKAQQISRLAPDIQRNLVSHNINVLTSVPEGPYVGIEIPNIVRQTIRLGDVVTTAEFEELEKRCILPMCLGKDTKGTPVVADLTQAPHLLIAGTTGSGKSAGLNSMLLTLLLTRSPAELRLIMVDPKTVEFTQYQGLPHLLTPIITDIDATVAALAWLIKEQERRYKLLSLLHLSKISQLNDYIKRENAQGRKVYDPMWSPDMGGYAPELKIVPYILLVVDEFADLMAVAASIKKADKNPEQILGRLAGKARAAGIHLIFATQTPRAEIVSGAIRANMSSRISYTVQNGTESKIVLDETGAENLLGQGDMMIKYQMLNSSRTFRAHGPFSSNDDVASIVQAWIDYAGEPEYVEGVTDIEDDSDVQIDVSDSQGPTARDELFDSVAAYARGEFYQTSKKKILSISEIQMEFGIGFPKAKKIRKQLIEAHVIGKDGTILFDE